MGDAVGERICARRRRVITITRQASARRGRQKLDCTGSIVDQQHGQMTSIMWHLDDMGYSGMSAAQTNLRLPEVHDPRAQHVEAALECKVPPNRLLFEIEDETQAAQCGHRLPKTIVDEVSLDDAHVVGIVEHQDRRCQAVLRTNSSTPQISQHNVWMVFQCQGGCAPTMFCERSFPQSMLEPGPPPLCQSALGDRLQKLRASCTTGMGMCMSVHTRSPSAPALSGGVSVGILRWPAPPRNYLAALAR